MEERHKRHTLSSDGLEQGGWIDGIDGIDGKRGREGAEEGMTRMKQEAMGMTVQRCVSPAQGEPQA